jgi:hypothetical protein
MGKHGLKPRPTATESATASDSAHSVILIITMPFLLPLLSYSNNSLIIRNKNNKHEH